MKITKRDVEEALLQPRPANETPKKGFRLGKLSAKSDMRMLNLADFLKADAKIPDVFQPWKSRSAFPLQTFGNNQWGCCTRASQAHLQMRMERLECRTTPKITDEEIIRAYKDMSFRLYGGGDNGAYEIDALKQWRNEVHTFKDIKGRPFLIDAFARINHFRLEEVKAALFLGQAKGIKVCFNMPMAWSRTPGGFWDVKGNATGEYRPGTWGGHSMTAVGYNKDGVELVSTWGYKNHIISWAAFAVYCDEAYAIIDSINSWRKNKAINKLVDLTAIKSEVNKISEVQIGK